jgi:hypothetical protein
MRILLILITVFIPVLASSQQTCKVLMPGLDSAYAGKCKNGLAHGSGEAWGWFHYIGKFSNGYPQGEGRADYPDGTYYIGNWDTGKRDGKGSIFIIDNGKTIEKAGIWENDLLEKVILPPSYKVITQRNINRLRVYKEGAGSNVWFYPNATGGLASDIQDIQLAGNTGKMVLFSPKLGFEDVMFPFTGSIRYKAWNKLRTQQYEIFVEIEISEPGSWIVEMQN